MKHKIILLSAIAILSVAVFAFYLIFYSTNSKASYTDCIPKRICNSNAQCGQSGRCVFINSTTIGRCVCFTIPTKEPTPTPRVPTQYPTGVKKPTPTLSYKPTPTPAPQSTGIPRPSPTRKPQPTSTPTQPRSTPTPSWM